MVDINSKLAEMKEWSKSVVFDAKGNIIGKHNCEPKDEEIQ